MLRFLIVMMLIVGCAAANNMLSRVEARQQRKPLSEFPSRLGDWKIVDEHKMGNKVLGKLGADDYLMRNYENGEGRVVGLYIGYFETQKEGKQVHSPRQCLPGSGWQNVGHSERSVVIKNREARFNVDVMGKGNSREMYIWWYQGRGRIYASEYWNKMYLIWDAVLKGRTDGALVRVNSSADLDSEDTLKRLVDFMCLLDAHLRLHLTE